MGLVLTPLNETAEEPWGGTKDASGYNHTVWVKNLKPNTNYYYMVELVRAVEPVRRHKVVRRSSILQGESSFPSRESCDGGKAGTGRSLRL
jgi:phosphodiesterase/alkaline phosphatase D-like protein